MAKFPLFFCRICGVRILPQRSNREWIVSETCDTCNKRIFGRQTLTDEEKKEADVQREAFDDLPF